MFTCPFEKQCIDAEEEEKKKHFGKVTRGIKYWWKKVTWIPWLRDDCSGQCLKFLEFRRISYEKTLKSEVFNSFLKRTSKQ